MANFATGYPVTLNAAAEARCTGGRPRHDKWAVDMPHEPQGSRKVTITAVLSKPWERVHVVVDLIDDLEPNVWKAKLLAEFLNLKAIG